MDHLTELMFEIKERAESDWVQTGSVVGTRSGNDSSHQSRSASRSIQISPSSSEQSHYINRSQLDEALGKPSEPYISKLIAEGRLTLYRIAGRNGQWFDLRQVGQIVRRRRRWEQSNESQANAQERMKLLCQFIELIGDKQSVYYRYGALSVLSDRFAMPSDELSGKQRKDYAKGQKMAKQLIDNGLSMPSEKLTKK